MEGRGRLLGLVKAGWIEVGDRMSAILAMFHALGFISRAGSGDKVADDKISDGPGN